MVGDWFHWVHPPAVPTVSDTAELEVEIDCAPSGKAGGIGRI
jgi:hypothetical protein